jgi:hypothetical protein
VGGAAAWRLQARPGHTPCGVRSSPPRWTPGRCSGASRKQPPMPIRVGRCVMTTLGNCMGEKPQVTRSVKVLSESRSQMVEGPLTWAGSPSFHWMHDPPVSRVPPASQRDPKQGTLIGQGGQARGLPDRRQAYGSAAPTTCRPLRTDSNQEIPPGHGAAGGSTTRGQRARAHVGSSRPRKDRREPRQACRCPRSASPLP